MIDERMQLSRSFQYSKGFLQWALLVPSYAPDWHLGVRLASSGKLMAFITAVLLPHIPLCPHTSFAQASGGCASTPSPQGLPETRACCRIQKSSVCAGGNTYALTGKDYARDVL